MGRIISYRGLLADGEQDIINLHTNDGKTGYKIVKLDVFPENPGHTADKELLVTVWSVEQATHAAGPATTVDFNNQELLAVGYFTENSSGSVVTNPAVVIFDNRIVNQDIFVINQDQSTGESANYYIELEQIDLTEDQALVAIIKNLRNEQ